MVVASVVGDMEEKAFDNRGAKVGDKRADPQVVLLAFIKRFKIFSTRYQSRKRSFRLGFNLFAVICNFEINRSNVKSPGQN
jgi:hypothetical protein